MVPPLVVVHYQLPVWNAQPPLCWLAGPIPTPTPAIMEMEGLGKPQCNSKAKYEISKWRIFCICYCTGKESASSGLASSALWTSPASSASPVSSASWASKYESLPAAMIGIPLDYPAGTRRATNYHTISYHATPCYRTQEPHCIMLLLWVLTTIPYHIMLHHAIGHKNHIVSYCFSEC